MITEGSLLSPHLITSYTATLCEDDFEVDEENDHITPKNDSFLKNVEKRCNLEDVDQKERYSSVRNQVLDKVKKLMTSSSNRERRPSISSTSSLKRSGDLHGSDEEDSEKHPSSKPRIKSPLKMQ